MQSLTPSFLQNSYARHVIYKSYLSSNHRHQSYLRLLRTLKTFVFLTYILLAVIFHRLSGKINKGSFFKQSFCYRHFVVFRMYYPMINTITTLRHNQHVVEVIFTSTVDIWIGRPDTCLVELMNGILGKNQNQINPFCKLTKRIIKSVQVLRPVLQFLVRLNAFSIRPHSVMKKLSNN